MSRLHARGALLAALATTALTTTALLAAPAPASAADIQGGNASAATLTLGGQGNGTGTFTARYDGTRLTTSGTNSPAISLLQGQSLLSAGVLAQDATASAAGSAACAGLAGQGATVAQVGEGRCLTGGDVLRLDPGTVDLSGVQLLPSQISDGLPQELRDGLGTALGPVTQGASQAFRQVLAGLGNPALRVGLGAVEGRCTAGAGGPDGDATLANASVQLEVPGREEPLTLLTLPEKPRPNSDYSADLGQLSELVLADLRTQLEEGFDGGFAGALPVVDEAAAINAILTEASKQLQPVTGRVVSVVANKQSRTATSIDLTALDLRLLPGQVQGADGLRLQVGSVQCGPSEVVQPAAAPAPPKKATGLPVGVSAGLAAAPPEPARAEPLLSAHDVMVGAAALGLASLAGLAMAHRRRLL